MKPITSAWERGRPAGEFLASQRNQPPAKPRRSRGAFTLIECLVYLGVYVALVGFGSFAFYRCYDHMKAMRRNSEDIINAVHAGEAWRNDIRQAAKPLRFEPADQTLRIQRSDKEIAYRFANGQVLRQSSAGAPWLVLLPRVQRSEMQADPRAHVTAWRWELELQNQQKSARVRPLFTFVAAPPQP
jgi:hypothetical protein